MARKRQRVTREMRRRNRPYLKELYWFPTRMVDMNRVRANFSIEYVEDMDETVILEMFKFRERRGEEWVGLPRGDRKRVLDCLHRKQDMIAVKDRRTSVPVRYRLRFMGSFRKGQLRAAKKLARTDGGVLKSAPRTGKTVMGTQAIIESGERALILAHQTDLIEQFCRETINDPSGELFNGASFKQPVAGICNTLAQFEQYDICLATYQTFLSERGQHLLRQIKDSFGVVLVDEVHRAPADRYSQILSQFSAKHLWGLTATNDRKDGLYDVTVMMIGPVAHRVRAKSLKAKVYAHETGVKHRQPPKTWQGMINFLFRSRERNELIAETALRDVRRGHTVLIPVTTHEHAELIRKEIIAQSGDNKIVFTFTGQIPKNRREWARNIMRNNRKARIHIAMRSMLTGLNVPRWSACYTVAPITNPPLYEQEIFRVCTPMEGKPTPIIRYFHDSVLPSSRRWIDICGQTLTSPDHGHRVTDSFHRLRGAVRAVQRTPDPDGLDVVRSPGNMRSLGKLRF